MELYRGPCLAVAGGGTILSGVLGATTPSPPAFSLTGLLAVPAGTVLSSAAGVPFAGLISGAVAPLLNSAAGAAVTGVLGVACDPLVDSAAGVSTAVLLGAALALFVSPGSAVALDAFGVPEASAGLVELVGLLSSSYTGFDIAAGPAQRMAVNLLFSPLFITPNVHQKKLPCKRSTTPKDQVNGRDPA